MKHNYLISFCAWLTVVLVFASVLPVQVSAQVPPRPEPAYAVNDFANLFTPVQRMEMERTLVTFADSTSNRVVVVTINDLNGYEPSTFAYEIGEKWGVGSAEFDNGVVVLVKPKTHDSKGQVYIAVGYGLEGVIPDAIAKRIIENEMIPHFRENDYYGGVEAALKVIISLAKGEYSKEEYADSGESFMPFLYIVVIIMLILMVLGSRKGRGKGPTDIGGRGSSRSSVAEAMFWGSLLGGGYSGGGRSSGGGFSGGFGGGFGGGHFGGGGAGGSW